MFRTLAFICIVTALFGCAKTSHPEKESDEYPTGVSTIHGNYQSDRVHLIDVNTAPIPLSSSPEYLTSFDHRVYFSADDGIHGRELWVTDGTQATMVADIDPSGSSNPSGFIESAGWLYFSAFDADHGFELWRTQGQSVERVTDCYPGPVDGVSTGHFAVGGWVYFDGKDPEHGVELWRTNGVLTQRITDVNPGKGDSEPRKLAELDGWVYFSARSSDNEDSILWRTNGTVVETVTDLKGGGSVSPVYLIDLMKAGQNIYFVSDNNQVSTLWRVAGQHAERIKELGLGYLYIKLATYKNELYFTDSDSVNGKRLWKTDGVNVNLVYGVTLDEAIQNPDSVYVSEGWLYVRAPEDNAYSVWRTNGTSTEKVISDPEWIISTPLRLGNEYFFKTLSRKGGYELWHSDGQTRGKVENSKVSKWENPTPWLVMGDWLYFIVDIGTDTYQYVLWRVNANHVLEQVFVPGTSEPVDVTRCYERLPADTQFLFDARDSQHGKELWRLTATGVQRISDIDSRVGTESSEPYLATSLVYQGRYFFYAQDALQGWGLWSTDGQTTQRLEVNVRTWPLELMDFEGAIYFPATDEQYGMELWRSDGNTVMRVTDINPDSGDSDPSGFFKFGDSLYFTAVDAENGRELWRLHAGQVERLSDVNPGSQNSNPGHFLALNDWLYFEAVGQDRKLQLWRTKGSEVQFVANTNFGSSYSSVLNEPIVYSGRVYFVGYDKDHGEELWRTTADGTAAELFHDTDPGAMAGYLPFGIKIVNGKMFYLARKGNSQILWSTNGTDKTSLDITALGLDNFYDLVPFNDALYFSAKRSDVGNELWRTNGVNVELVADVARGDASGFPSGLTAIGGNLYFTAFNGDHSAIFRFDGHQTVQLSPADKAMAYSNVIPFNEDLIFSQSSDSISSLFTYRDGRFSMLHSFTNSGLIYIMSGSYQVVGQRFFYIAEDGVHGQEPWYYQP